MGAPNRERSSPRRLAVLCAVLLLSLGALVADFAVRRWPRAEPAEPPPPMVEAPTAVKTWKQMARKVEEPRGELVGRAASVTVPPELRHYSDRRRFLAIQVAASREREFDLPHDYAELLRLIERDQLVEMSPLGDAYILYGVGGHATGDPFTHYDRATGAEIPLYDGWADARDAFDEMGEEVERLRAQVTEERRRLARVPRTRANRSRRRALQARVRGGQTALRLLEARRKLLASFYENYQKRRLVVSEHRLLAERAAHFGGRSYDLGQPAQRLRFKARLLSFLRPEARDILLEIAAGYQAAFGRPLPVTSLVRTLGYQRTLTRTNRSATPIDLPPHATGMAFDVHDGHMTATEQQYVMDAIARLEQADRVEALREPNDHIHVFVLPDGRLPSERLIALSAREVAAAARPQVRPPASKRRPAVARPGARKPAVPGGKGSTAPRPAPQRRQGPRPAR